MSRIILLVGALALAVASTTTVIAANVAKLPEPLSKT
jgi:hypothetical protein